MDLITIPHGSEPAQKKEPNFGHIDLSAGTSRRQTLTFAMVGFFGLPTSVIEMPAKIAYGSRLGRLPYAILVKPLARASLRRAPFAPRVGEG
jgi:hypothetical protein